MPRVSVFSQNSPLTRRRSPAPKPVHLCSTKITLFYQLSIQPKVRNGTRSSFSIWWMVAYPPIWQRVVPEQIEEERRVLGVAMTRAKLHLHLIQPLRFFRSQQHRSGDSYIFAPRSRFIPDAILDLFECRAWPTEVWRAQSTRIPVPISPPDARDVELNQADGVME